MHLLPRSVVLGGTLILAAAAGAATTYETQIYKWVDDEGVTHYTQHPPRDAEARLFEPLTSSAEPPAGDTAPDASTASQATADEGDGSATVAEYCKKMRDTATTLTGGGAIQMRQDDGSLKPLDGEARQQKLTEVRGLIAKHCSG